MSKWQCTYTWEDDALKPEVPKPCGHIFERIFFNDKGEVVSSDSEDACDSKMKDHETGEMYNAPKEPKVFVCPVCGNITFKEIS